MLTHKGTYLWLFAAPWWVTPIWVLGFLFAQAGAAGWAQAAMLAPTQTPPPQAQIDLPRPGEPLQGMVSISGTTDIPGFRSAEISFAYQADQTNTWFILQQSVAPVKAGALAAWDTTTITDGIYRLRLQVFLQDGQVQERLVTGLRVRNYTLIETSTPAPEASPSGQETPTPTSTPRTDFQVTPVEVTPLPTNPAQVTPQHLGLSTLRGVLIVVAVSLAGGLYLGMRTIFRR
jgi:hypothetical protein